MSTDKSRPTVDVNALLSQVKTASAASEPAPKQPESASAPDGAAFMGGDGRTLYRYTIEGETVVLTKPIDKMSEQDFYDQLPFSFGGAESQRLPQNLSVKFKDPQWAGHWFNRKANAGQRVSEAKAMGFVPAKREDCEWVAHSINDEDGAIVDNDLVLMKVHKINLMRKVKTWMDEAIRKGGKDAYKQVAENSVGSQKVSHYHTPQSNEFSGLGPVTQIPTVS